MEHLFMRVFGGSPQFWLTGGDVLNKRAMPSDSTKLLVDLRKVALAGLKIYDFVSRKKSCKSLPGGGGGRVCGYHTDESVGI